MAAWNLIKGEKKILSPLLFFLSPSTVLLIFNRDENLIQLYSSIPRLILYRERKKNFIQYSQQFFFFFFFFFLDPFSSILPLGLFSTLWRMSFDSKFFRIQPVQLTRTISIKSIREYQVRTRLVFSFSRVSRRRITSVHFSAKFLRFHTSLWTGLYCEAVEWSVKQDPWQGVYKSIRNNRVRYAWNL